MDENQLHTSEPHSPNVSVCIVSRNEQSHIRRCLDSLVSSPSAVRFELIVVDNDSQDETLREVENFAQEHPQIALRTIQRRFNHLGAARAQAIEQATGDWVAFIDADCTAPRGWIDGLVQELLSRKVSHPETAAVGSGNVASADSPFNRALRVMLSCFLGSFGTVQGRPLRQAVSVRHLSTCNVLYDRKLVLKVGNFSDDFRRVCEDTELSARLSLEGYLLRYLPGLEVTHDHRPLVRLWAEKMFRYGWGQIQVASRYPSHLRGIKALPLLATVLFLSLACFQPRLTAWLVLMYAVLIGLYSFALLFKAGEKTGLTLKLSLLFATTHLFYAAGETYGVLLVFFQQARRLLPKALPLHASSETEGSSIP